MTRTQRYLYWGVPLLFSLFVFWFGLKTWFMQDDFAWLSLPLAIRSKRDLFDALLAPKAQGTIRPWSERLFFLLFNFLFGFDARPYRLWVFLNQCLNLSLLTALMWRVTGSRVAAFTAPLLWTANTCLTTAMAWTSAYNEVQCSGFLLGALYLFVRYTQTGERRYYWWQWVVFALGFGSLELNVVYPAIALVYALYAARPYWRQTVPMFAVSVIYALIHRSFAPKQVSYFYKMYFDSSLIPSFATYWNWALGFGRVPETFVFPKGLATAATILVTLALAAFVIERLWRRQWIVLLGPAWYLAILAPVLPLRNHVTDYYLTMPVIGLAILGGYAVGVAWQKGWLWRGGAVTLAALYLCANVPVTRHIMEAYYTRSKKVEVLVESVAFAHQLHPNNIIVLNGIGQDLFWGAIYDRSFRALEIPDVYLTAESRADVSGNANLSSIEEHFLSPAILQQALRKRQAQVYQVTDDNLRNVTAKYLKAASGKPAEKPQSVDVANPLFAEQLGEGWLPGDKTHRWMGKSASVYLGGPKSREQKLYLKGTCAAQAVEREPLAVSVLVDGEPLKAFTLTKASPSFAQYLELPPSLVGRGEVKITLTVSRTVQVAPDPRDLGLAFGIIAIQ